MTGGIGFLGTSISSEDGLAVVRKAIDSRAEEHLIAALHVLDIWADSVLARRKDAALHFVELRNALADANYDSAEGRFEALKRQLPAMEERAEGGA